MLTTSIGKKPTMNKPDEAPQKLLCIPSHLGMDQCGFVGTAAIPFSLNDMAIMERTPELENNTRWLHFVAYVAVTVPSKGLILTYAREGTETRLHGKRSIGVGGHIEEGTRGTLTQHCMLEAQREVEEELGIDISKYPLEFEGIVQEQITPVGRVHVGLCYTLQLDDIPPLDKGDGELLDPKFVSLDNVLLHYEDYELWSQMYAGGLARVGRLHF